MATYYDGPSETQVNTTPATLASGVVGGLHGGGHVTAWITYGQGGVGNGVFTQRFGIEGEPLGGETQVNGPTTGSQKAIAVIGMAGGGYAVVWTSSPPEASGGDEKADTFVRLYDASGAPLASEVKINSAPSRDLNTSATALSSGGFVVAWHEPDTRAIVNGQFVGSAGGLMLQQYDADGAAVGTPIQSPTSGHRTALAGLADGGWVLVTTSPDFDATVYGADGVARFSLSDIVFDNPPTLRWPDISVAGLTGGGYVVTWTSGGGDADIYSRQFDATGVAVTPERRVNTVADTYDPEVVALPDGGYLITYTGHVFVNDIFAQRFDAAGVAVGAEFVVHTSRENSQSGPDAALRTDGAIVVAWTDDSGDNIGQRVLSPYIQATSPATEGPDTLNGGPQNDILSGLGGDDSLNGLDGDDILVGGEGADALNGGAGSDTASYADAAAGVNVSLSTPAPVSPVYGEPTTDTLTSIENLIGSAFFDTLKGDDGANVLSGGDGGDRLFGEGGDDRLIGGDGADEIFAGMGDDHVDGGSGSDVINYSQLETSNSGSGVGVTVSLNTAGPQDTIGAGIDTLVSISSIVGTQYADNLTGDGDANDLRGNAGNDQLSGGGGWDYLTGGDGDDILDGGDGLDTANYNDIAGQNGQGVTVSLSISGPQNTAAAGIDTLTSIENLTGSQGSDTLEGNLGDNVLLGEAGEDLVTYAHATAGVTVSLSTTLAQNTGGAGLDTLSGFENLEGSAFGDILTGDDGANLIRGGAGNDELYGLAGDDILDGGAGEDLIQGGDGNDLLLGGEGTDTLEGGAGDDILDGGGNLAGAGVEVMDGGAGVDTVTYAQSSGGVGLTLVSQPQQIATGRGTVLLTNIENLTGSAFGDYLRGDFNDNILDGGAGNDVLQGGAGNDTLIGGDGVDEANYADDAAVVVSLAITGPQNTGGSGVDTLIGIERLNGSRNADILTGSDGDNLIFGDAGDDIIEGGLGNDTLHGSGGADTASYRSASGGVTVSLKSSGWQDTGAAGSDNLILVENLTGSAFGDTLTGDSGVNVLAGMGGDDILNGGEGADTLDGGAGFDTASYAGAAAGVYVSLGATPATGVGIATTDALISIEYLSGSSFGDTLVGGDDTNVLSGMSGDDVLHGRAGDDFLYGGFGNDILNGGAGQDLIQGGDGLDTADYSDVTPASGVPGVGVTVNLSIDAYQDTGAAGLDHLQTIERVRGSAYADHLIGDAGDNILWGGGGDDRLEGGAGADVLYGEGGADILDGGAGDDTLYGVNGDTLIGGAGDDILNADVSGTASYADATGAVQVNLRLAGAQNTGGAGVDTLINIVHLTGSQFADTLIGADSGSLIGMGGDDLLIAGRYSSHVDGGAGVDTASYADLTRGVLIDMSDAEVETLEPGFGHTITDVENLIGTGFNDTLGGNVAANHIAGGAGADILWGREGNDTLLGGDGNDNVIGGLGDDVLDGGAGVDTVRYQEIGDTVPGNGQGVTLSLLVSGPQNTGGAGVDTITGFENIVGSVYGDVLTGDDGVNLLNGGDGNDTLIGGGGDDNLYAGLGDDIINGGAGRDVANYSNVSAPFDANLPSGNGPIFKGNGFGVTLDLRLNTAQDTGGAGVDTVIDIENVQGTGYGDVLRGTDGDNVLIGNGGDDSLHGGLGSDTLLGGAGDDVLNGGASTNGTDTDILSGLSGIDTVTFVDSGAVTVSLAIVGSQATGGGNVIISDVENLTGSAFNDVLTGDDGINVLIGGGGNDTLDGGAGADRLYGGIANDTYRVDGQSDLVFEFAGEGTDTVVTTANFYLYDQIEALTLASGAGDIFGVGNGLANTIAGNEGANLLLGGGGDDAISGGAGNDRLFGEDGADTLHGEAGDDQLVGGAGDDQLAGGGGADTLYGEDGNDILVGNAGADILIAGAGNDVLDGRFGGAGEQDLMDGGAGDDLYHVDAANDLTFEAAGGGTDTVMADFADGTYYLYANVENLMLAGTTKNGVGNELDNTLTGNGEANWLLGGAGNDTLNGKGGNDVIFGQGGADIFVFEAGTGGDVVADFTSGVDRVQLSGIYHSFAEVQSHMHQNGTDTAIDLGQAHLVVFHNVAMNAFTASDFLF